MCVLCTINLPLCVCLVHHSPSKALGTTCSLRVGGRLKPRKPFDGEWDGRWWWWWCVGGMVVMMVVVAAAAVG